MRIVHISDFHFTKFTLNPFRLFPKRIFGHLNWLFFRRKEFAFEQLKNLPDVFKQLNVDLILFGGDFSSSSMPEEFEVAKTFLNTFEIPWIAIPGNHDQYTKSSHCKKRFYKYFQNTHPSCACLAKEGVEAHKISDNLWVVAMDTAKPNCIRSSQGMFSKPLEAQLEHLLSSIPAGAQVILLNHYPFFATDASSRSLERGQELEKLLKKHPNVCLYLHGHTHRNSVADLRPDNLPIVLDSGSCSLKDHGFWNLIDLKDAGCTVSTYQWKGSWEKNSQRDFTWIN